MGKDGFKLLFIGPSLTRLQRSFPCVRSLSPPCLLFGLAIFRFFSIQFLSFFFHLTSSASFMCSSFEKELLSGYAYFCSAVSGVYRHIYTVGVCRGIRPSIASETQKIVTSSLFRFLPLKRSLSRASPNPSFASSG